MKIGGTKGIVIGFLIGSLVFGGSSVFADTIKSLLGAKVTGLFSIEQGDKKIADAVIINGSAYAPVRAVMDASGTKFTVEGKVIRLEAASYNEGNALSPEDTEKQSRINALNNRVLTERGFIKLEEANIKMYEESLVREQAREEKIPSAIEAIIANIEKCRERIAGHQAQITAAEAEIARIQAEIDASK